MILFIYRNEKCKALITTNKEKYFSNGADLSFIANAINDHIKKQSIPKEDLERRRSQLAAEVQIEFRTRLKQLYSRILTFPMPTVAAIKGKHIFKFNLLGS